MVEKSEEQRLNIPNNHNGLHFLSLEQNQQYESLYLAGRHEEALNYLRECWSNSVDREFIQGFRLIHWTAGLAELSNFLSSPQNKVEISTQAYRSPPFDKGWLHSGVGIEISGKVRLAGNADLQTNQWSGLTKKNGKRLTEYANRLCTNRGNCTSPYEFVVSDWKPVSIVMRADSIVDPREVIIVAEKFNLLVLNSNGEIFIS